MDWKKACQWVAVFGATLVLICGCAPGPVQNVVLATQVQGQSIETQFHLEDGIAWIEVYAGASAGSLDVTIEDGDYPRQVGLQIFRPSLERLQFAYEGTEVGLSVGSQADRVVTQWLRSDLEATPETQPVSYSITPDSPFWMGVRIINLDRQTPGSQATYFEVMLPADFIANRHTAFSLAWPEEPPVVGNR